MIPQEILREHIINALSDIDRDGYPVKHKSTQWDLFFDGKTYPPKWTILIAGKYALGEEHSDKLFSGGPETNDFLNSRGFQVFPKRPSCSVHSWTVENSISAYKVLDKSAFLHRGTGVPVEVRPFFLGVELIGGERRTILLEHQGVSYPAHIEMDNQPSPRTRLFWNSDFSALLKVTFPHHHKLYSSNESPDSEIVLRFERLSGFDEYRVSFAGVLADATIAHDVEAEEVEERGPQSEGSVKEYYGKRYERSPKNRKEAIRIHGLSCNACGFNFEKVYGARGADYIEVHHIKPIHTFEDEQPVDPSADLVTVCSNCHRIIHRKSKDILSVDDVKVILQEMRAGV